VTTQPAATDPTPSAARPGSVRRIRDEGGFSAGAEVMLVGTLVFMTTMLIALNAWNMLDASMAVASAAREGARAFVESDEPASADADARAAALDATASLGRDAPDVAVTGTLARCEVVTVTVRLEVQLLRVPFLTLPGDLTRTVTDSHSELVDPFRSGLPGTAACP
jgi:hypothetical protein